MRTGFYATRIVWAAAPDIAEKLVQDKLVAELGARGVERQSGASLTVDKCLRIHWLRTLLPKPAGFTFFEE